MINKYEIIDGCIIHDAHSSKNIKIIIPIKNITEFVILKQKENDIDVWYVRTNNITLNILETLKEAQQWAINLLNDFK